MPLPLLKAWRQFRGREGRAREYVMALMAEPSPAIAAELAAHGDGDGDHARWELRYVRRAVGLLVAQRDALDDRTASEVAAALASAHDADPHVGANRRDIADAQFNERLRTYGSAMADRAGEGTSSDRLARALLQFAGAKSPDANALVFARETVSALALECNASLRKAYGEASLPSDIRPSELK